MNSSQEILETLEQRVNFLLLIHNAITPGSDLNRRLTPEEITILQGQGKRLADEIILEQLVGYAQEG